MPGANCFIFGSRTNRRHSEVGIFRILAGKDKKSKEIRNAWIKVVTPDRVVDENFRRQIDSGNLYVCERHFKKGEIDCSEYYAIFYVHYVLFLIQNKTNQTGHVAY